MPFDAADLAAFLDPSMPGYARAEVGGKFVDGLFRQAPAEAFGLVTGVSPSLLARASDVEDLIDGQIVTLAGREYTAVGRRQESPDLTRIFLAL